MEVDIETVTSIDSEAQMNSVKVKISEIFFQLFLMQSCKDTCSNNWSCFKNFFKP